MAKKNKRQLEFEAWLRRLQSALVNVEGAASLWGGCDSEAMDYSDLDDPCRRFMFAMEGETEEEQRISQRLWDLAQDMAQAIERGREAMKKPEGSE